MLRIFKRWSSATLLIQKRRWGRWLMPIIVAGDGIFWSKGSAKLRELVEMLSIPVITRRMGRGAVPEDHPLSFSGGFRRPIQNQSDLVVIIGLRMNILEGFNLPPRFPSENVKYIQIAEDPEELTTRLPTEYSISGSPKQVLRQMINFARLESQRMR
jgi:acetolactate synthase I/II/III large subunit